MADVEFTDNSVKVKAALEDAINIFLLEVGQTMQRQVANNTRIATGDTAGKWDYVVDESKHEVTIGNPLENAIWEEFGTGEHALEGKGRKGGWWIKVGNGKNEINEKTAKKYKWVKVLKDENGNWTYVFTRGKEGNRALLNAYIAKKKAIIRRGETVLKARFKE